MTTAPIPHPSLALFRSFNEALTIFSSYAGPETERDRGEWILLLALAEAAGMASDARVLKIRNGLKPFEVRA